MDASYLRYNEAFSVLPEVKFTNSKGKKVSFDVFLCNFARIFEHKMENENLIGPYTPKEMIHTAVGLISVCLVSMNKSTIYDVLDEKSTATIFFMYKEDACCEYIQMKTPNKKSKNEAGDQSKQTIDQIRIAIESIKPKVVADDDDYESSAASASKFDLIFESDIATDTEEGDDGDRTDSQKTSARTSAVDSEIDEEVNSDTSEETDHGCSHGYNTFLTSCLQRKIALKEMNNRDVFEQNNSTILPLIGPEHRIAAVCTFRIRKVDKCKRILHIIFLSVRKHLRRLGIGTKILEILKRHGTFGIYDALVVHADTNALDFFSRNGFSDDPLLNRQWSCFAGEYVNCSLMTYFPPVAFGKKSVEALDKEIEDSRAKSAEAHEIQFTLCKCLKEEVAILRKTVRYQEILINQLKIQLIKKRPETFGPDLEIQSNGGDSPRSGLSLPPRLINEAQSAEFPSISINRNIDIESPVGEFNNAKATGDRS